MTAVRTGTANVRRACTEEVVAERVGGDGELSRRRRVSRARRPARETWASTRNTFDRTGGGDDDDDDGGGSEITAIIIIVIRARVTFEPATTEDGERIGINIVLYGL
jgi:hypothetical protein